LRRKRKQALQVIISLGVAIGIFYYLYRDIEPSTIFEALKQTQISWIFASIFISIVGYLLRAWRWKLLIEAGETKTINTFTVFWALMFGYLINLIIPRAGEVARCGAIQRTYKSEMGKLFGTVVLERSIDLIFMVLMIMIAFIAQGGVFLEIFQSIVSTESMLDFAREYYLLAFAGVLVLIGSLFLLYRAFGTHSYTAKIRQFMRQFVSGLEAVLRLKNHTGFLLSSIVIWVIYFYMMYFVTLAMPATASLGAFSVLMVLVMGSIGMVAPVQGGIGTFHAMVIFILLFYGIEEEQGKIFAIVVHGSQMLTILALGTLSIPVLLKRNLKQVPIV